MTARLPLMASLAEHRRDLGVPAQQVADRLGVAGGTVSAWEAGRRSPHWASLIGYAAALGRRVVVWGDSVLAEGLDVPAALRGLRKRRGLDRPDFAARLGVVVHTVTVIESRRGLLLSTVDRYVTALGYELLDLPLEAP